MADASKEFFDELGRRGHEPLLKALTGTMRVDLVRGKRIDNWLVTVNKGDIAISTERGEADCVVRTKKELFDAVVRGEANMMATLMRGAVRVEGDPELLVRFQRLLPGPPSSRDERRAAGYARRLS